MDAEGRLGIGRRGRGTLAATAALVIALAACDRGKAPDAAETTYGAPPEGVPRDVAVLEVTGFGEIRIELFAEEAPKTVASFEKLAREGFYDGTTFHRVIPGFMIQGGDPNSKNRDPRDDGQGGPGFRLEDERSGIDHRRGIVSMANTGRRDTGGSQFFILVADNPDLNGGYTAFGRVIAGMDVVDRIVATPRDEFARHGPPDRPIENVVVGSVRIEPAASEPAAGATPPPATGSAPPVGSGPPVLGIDLESTLERARDRVPLEPGARLDEAGRTADGSAGAAAPAERGEFAE